MMRGNVINGADLSGAWSRLGERNQVGLAATSCAPCARVDQHWSSERRASLRGHFGGARLVHPHAGRRLAARPGLGTGRRIHVPHDARDTGALRRLSLHRAADGQPTGAPGRRGQPAEARAQAARLSGPAPRPARHLDQPDRGLRREHGCRPLSVDAPPSSARCRGASARSPDQSRDANRNRSWKAS